MVQGIIGSLNSVHFETLLWKFLFYYADTRVEDKKIRGARENGESSEVFPPRCARNERKKIGYKPVRGFRDFYKW